jgi:hypothetical protein
LQPEWGLRLRSKNEKETPFKRLLFLYDVI